MATATNIYAADWRNGTAYVQLQQVTSSSFNIWAGYETMNYCSLIRFDTASPASGLVVTMYTGPNGGSNSASVTLRYILLDAANTAYQNATNSMACDGTFTYVGNGTQKQTITINKTVPAGTHYLYIWTNAGANVLNYGSFRMQTGGTYGMTITYTELQGAVRIDNGSGWDTYTVYIDTGSGWARYIPYIDTGSAWQLYGG